MNGFSGAIRKPDLLLCEKSVIQKHEVTKNSTLDLRTDVYVIGEVKQKNTPENVKVSFVELAGKAAFQLEAQDGRYATPGIQFLGTDIVFTLFDRGGSISTHPLNIHEHPKEFLRILLGIAFGDGTLLGFDSTISPVMNGRRNIRIVKEGTEWVIAVDQLLFLSGSLHGRGTTVWSGVVTESNFPGLGDGEAVVVKDCFVDPMRRHTEGKILMILEEFGIEGVPRLIHEQQVQTRHLEDGDLLINQATHILRSLVADPLPHDCKYHLRVQTRMVSTPKGEPIYEFSSLAELLVGIVDSLQGESHLTDILEPAVTHESVAHLDAFVIAGVLHRDISLFNLLFVTLAEGKRRAMKFLQTSALSEDEGARLTQKIADNVARRGLLADWGYAIPNQKPTKADLRNDQPGRLSSVPDSSPTLYVRLPGSGSETTMKRQRELNGKDSIVIPLVHESLPEDPNSPIDASPLHRTVRPQLFCLPYHADVHQGTWAWMATELSYVVPGTPVIHRPHHDLESFFYILVAICLMYDTPNATKPPKKLAQCFDPLFAISEPSILKTLNIQSDFGWTALILPNISQYFSPLIPLLEHLRRELILPIKLENGVVQTNSSFTHQTFINAVVKTLAELPESSWRPTRREGGVTIVAETHSSSASNTAMLPPSFAVPSVAPSIYLSDETLPRRYSLRATGTSSGNGGVKRSLDPEENTYESRGKKRAQLNSRPADASGSGASQIPDRSHTLVPPKPAGPFAKLREFSSAPR